MSSLNFKNAKTEEEIRELIGPKPESYVRIVNGIFFRHTTYPDGHKTVETLNNLD